MHTPATPEERHVRPSPPSTVTITDRGRPVARMTAIPASRLEGLLESGEARPARRSIADLPAPEDGPGLSAVLAAMRDEDLC